MRQRYDLLLTDRLTTTQRKLGRLVLNTCIPLGLFTLELANCRSVQFMCCEQTFTPRRPKKSTRLPRLGDAIDCNIPTTQHANYSAFIYYTFLSVSLCLILSHFKRFSERLLVQNICLDVPSVKCRRLRYTYDIPKQIFPSPECETKFRIF